MLACGGDLKEEDVDVMARLGSELNGLLGKVVVERSSSSSSPEEMESEVSSF